MSLATGTSGVEAVIAETQFFKTTSLDLKTPTHTSQDASRTDVSGEEVVEGTPPVTSRWELWAWYAYAFGNNSAGPLSYAPLSIYHRSKLFWDILTITSLPIRPQPSRFQRP